MKALCYQAGVSEATIASWKKGDPSTVTTLQKIINVLGPDTLVEMMVQSTTMPGAVDYARMAKMSRLQAEYFERMAGIDSGEDETSVAPKIEIEAPHYPNIPNAPKTLYGWLQLLPGHLAADSIAYMSLRNGDRACTSMNSALNTLCEYLIGADIDQEWYWRGVAAFFSHYDEETIRPEIRTGYAAAKKAFTQVSK